MMFIYFVASFLFGGIAGVTIMCLCIAAKDAQRNWPDREGRHD